MEQSQIDIAKQIVNAMKTSGRDDIPVVGPPGEAPPPGSSPETLARFEKAEDAYHRHLMNMTSAELAKDPVAQRDLLLATIAGLNK